MDKHIKCSLARLCTALAISMAFCFTTDTFAQDAAATDSTATIATEIITAIETPAEASAGSDTVGELVNGLNTVWMLLAAMLVFFMQPGFALVEAGFTRTKNTANILMKNFVDFMFGSLLYWFIGFGLMFGAGGFFALAVSWMKYGKPSLSLTLNGILAGLVGITAGCDMVSPFGAVIIGTICGILMIYSVEFIDRTLKIDDPVGASSVHGVCGFTGTILTGLFSTSEGLFYGAGWNFLGAQVFGALVVSLWAASMGFIIFKGLDKIHGLRVSKRVEEEGLDIYEHGESAYGA